jgi:replicative DNA helicase
MKRAIADAENGDDCFLEEARETLDTVNTIGASEIRMLNDLLPEVVNRLGDTTRGKQTGFTGLDAVTGGLREGHLVIIAARPGIGKTSFACNMAANMCRQGMTCAYFSIEMSAVEIAERISLSEAMVDRYKAQRDSASAKLLMDAQEKVWNWKLYIDDRGSLSVGQVVSNAYKYRQRSGSLDCIFIDYLQLMRLPSGKNDSKNERIGEATRGLKILANEFKCPVVALAQLNRNADGRRPTIADIRDSGNIEQDADLILLLHRESDQPEDATLIIGKNRHGATRDIPMIWKHQWTRYLETKLAK